MRNMEYQMIIGIVIVLLCLFYWMVLKSKPKYKGYITSEDLLGSAKTRDSAKQILEKLEKENKHYYELLLIQTVSKYYLNNPESILGKTLYDAITEYRKEKESEVETKTSPTGNYEYEVNNLPRFENPPPPPKPREKIITTPDKPTLTIR